MHRRTTALAVTAVLAATPTVATAQPPDPMPRESALEKYSALWHKCGDLKACDAPRNVRRHGIRFKWVSERNEKHRHWATRPAHADDVAVRIRRLRAQLLVITTRLSLTPFPGPGGTRWAIPWAIVACESGGSWEAANPSGAVGPYQLLGWGAPMPANTPAARLAHHRIAARLYRTAGTGPWVSSRHCWG